MSAPPPWPDPAFMLALVIILTATLTLITAVVRVGRTQAVHRDEMPTRGQAHR